MQMNAISILWKWIASAAGKKWILSVVMLSGALIAAWWVSLLNIAGIDEWLEERYFQLMDYSEPVQAAPNLRIIFIDEKDVLNGKQASDLEAWRSFHAEVVKSLANAGAKLVAFDMMFPEPANENIEADRKFAEAIKLVKLESKMRIILGVDEGEYVISSKLKSVMDKSELGCIKIGGMTSNTAGHSLRRVMIAESTFTDASDAPVEVISESEDITPSLSLRVVLSLKGQSAKYDTLHKRLVLLEGNRIVNTIRCEIETDRYSDPPMRRFFLPLHRINYSRHRITPESYVKFRKRSSFSDYRGKIVLVGLRTKASIDDEGEHISGSGGEELYGYDLHAGVISQFLLQKYPHKLTVAWQILILIATPLLAGIGRKYIPKKNLEIPIPAIGKKPLPIALLIMFAAYVVIVTAVYHANQTVFAPGYDLLGILLGYYICGQYLVPPQTSPAAPEKAAETNSDQK
jgi:CHASE2 domain-containing sensor protein